MAAALASYERALAIAPNANAYSNVGTLHYDERRYKEAIAAYQRALALAPRDPSLHRNLGDALRREGQVRPRAMPTCGQSRSRAMPSASTRRMSPQ